MLNRSIQSVFHRFSKKNLNLLCVCVCVCSLFWWSHPSVSLSSITSLILLKKEKYFVIISFDIRTAFYNNTVMCYRRRSVQPHCLPMLFTMYTNFLLRTVLNSVEKWKLLDQTANEYNVPMFLFYYVFHDRSISI